MKTNVSLIKVLKKGSVEIPLGAKKFLSSEKLKKIKSNEFITKFGECAGFMENAQKNELLIAYSPVNLSVPAIKNVKEWVNFINKLGFPCYYKGTEEVLWNNKFILSHSIEIIPDEYQDKGKDLLACHTLIRYAYSYKYSKIPIHTLNLYKTYDLSEYFCLYLGHLAQDENYDSYYGLLPNTNKFIYPPDIVGIKTLLYDRNINTAFKNEITKKTPLLPLTENTYEEYFKAIGINPKKR